MGANGGLYVEDYALASFTNAVPALYCSLFQERERDAGEEFDLDEGGLTPYLIARTSPCGGTWIAAWMFHGMMNCFPRWCGVATVMAFLTVIALRLPCAGPVLWAGTHKPSCCEGMKDGSKGSCCDEATPASKVAGPGLVALAILPVGVATPEITRAISFIVNETSDFSEWTNTSIRFHSPRAPPLEFALKVDTSKCKF